MITRKAVERLAQLKSDEGILTTYIRVSPRLMYDRKHPLTVFKGQIKIAERKLQSEKWKEALSRESKKILEFLEGWEAKGRGLAIFSCQPENIWEVIELEVLLPNFIDVDTTSKTAILTQVLDEYPRLAVLVVQRDKAAIYLSEQRVGRQTEEVTSNVPNQQDTGGWSQARLERHTEFHVDEHLKSVIEKLTSLDREQGFTRLAVGGTKETVDALAKALPESLGKRLIGRFAVDFKHENDAELLQNARELNQEYERKTELEVVQQVFDAAKSGNQGSLGVRQTLPAARENRIRTLVVADGISIDGCACAECGYFDQKKFKACPLCGGPGLEQDILDRVTEETLLTSGHVEIVHGEARERLKSEGGIGALLRY